jgi:hypothetical protein
MCEIHLQYYQVCPQFLLILDLGNLKYMTTMQADLPNPIYSSYKKSSKSTKSSIRLVAFRACHWNLLYLFVSNKAIWLTLIDRMNRDNLWSLGFQHSKRHKLHVTRHLEFLQKIHQNYDNLRHILLLFLNWLYARHLIVSNRKLRYKKISYLLRPTYLQRMNRRVVAVY